MRPRVAPKAARNAISFCRASERASSRHQQRQQRMFDRAGDLFLQRRQQQSRAGVRFLVLFGNACSDHAGFGLRLFEADPGAQPPDQIRPVHKPARELGLARLIRLVQIRRSERKLKALWQDADDRVLHIADRQALPNDALVTTKQALPQAVGQHRHTLGPGFVFARAEGATERGRDTQHLKEIRRHSRRKNALRLAVPGQNPAPARVGRETLEGATLLIILIIGVGKFPLRIVFLRGRLKQVHQLIRRPIRQRAQQGRVDHREDRCIRANAQAERQHGNKCEARMLE
jgi:hypothetical protein